MAQVLSQRLDPKVKNVWRITACLWIIPCLVVLVALSLVIGFASDAMGAGVVCATVFAVIFIVLFIAFVVVLPPVRYRRWSFELNQDYLEIARGGFFLMRRYTIPFIRVQNTDLRQGFIMRAFGLATVSVSTAANAHNIPGLPYEAADEFRARAAELARIAREDV